MNQGAHADQVFLEMIVDLIGVIRSDLTGVAQDAFLTDRNLSDLTAYRLGTIGEYTRRISQDVRMRHPEISWDAIYALRNIVAHHYQKLDKEKVWAVARNSLSALEAVCRAELDRFGG